MKNKIKIFLLAGVVTFCGTSLLSSCNSKKTGCPAETAQSRPDRRGNFSKNKGSTNLFPKDMRKRARIN
jgi:hypothetical protein